MILIALGANMPSGVGPPAETLRSALGTLPQQDVIVRKLSPFYRTVAWPNPHDPPFVNAVAEIACEHSPACLMDVLKGCERAFGRNSAERNAPRTLDLDILDYDGHVEEGPPILPHPRLHERAFVLIPLRDIAPSWRHPVSGRSLDALIQALPVGTPAPRKLA